VKIDDLPVYISLDDLDPFRPRSQPNGTPPCLASRSRGERAGEQTGQLRLLDDRPGDTVIHGQNGQASLRAMDVTVLMIGPPRIFTSTQTARNLARSSPTRKVCG
jgi:hypothetical protein